jgi:hypothetical protein
VGEEGVAAAACLLIKEFVAKGGIVVDKKDRDQVLEAMLSGILAAYYAARAGSDGDDPLENCLTMAHAALASLEAEGFEVVRKSDPRATRS